ncbi:MAG: PAS domain S-box protein [Streptosporangiaceae bacterium]
MAESLCRVQWTGRQAVVALPEHIDVSNAGQVRQELISVIDRGAEAVIAEMTATISCDQAGANAVARAYQRATVSGTQLRLVAAREIVRQVLGISGVDRLVPVYPSVEALAARVPVASSLLMLAGGPGGRSARSILPGAATQYGVGGEIAGRAGPETDVGMEVALLDLNGVIVSVNQAWSAFAEANGGDPARTGSGMSYLEACAAAGDDPVAREVAAVIRAALTGDLPGPLRVGVPCHGPRTARWFDMLISPRLNGGRCAGATVTFSLARSQPRSGLAASAAVWEMIDAFNDGVALADGDGTLVFANRRFEEMFGYQPAELHGQPVECLIPVHLRAAHRRHRAAWATAPWIRPMGAGARLVGLRKDGATFPAEIGLTPVQTASGRLAFTTVRDATAARSLAGIAAVAHQAHRGDELLDMIITSRYQVGLSLQAAAGLSVDAASKDITETLRNLDDAISGARRKAIRDPGR